jgi:hypothetical protein
MNDNTSISKLMIKFLNPDQTPIITADQPLFVLAKQIQWEWDTVYGEGKYVVILTCGSLF